MVPVLELQLETFALAPPTAGVVKTIEPLAEKNGNQVVVKGDGVITLHADQMRLRQASLNLMSNADKFTKKPTLTIAAHQGLGLVLPCWVQRNAPRPGRQSGL
jgi:signal transduction histidine kinase